jgi:two-component system sensor histidine kinase DesK
MSEGVSHAPAWGPLSVKTHRDWLRYVWLIFLPVIFIAPYLGRAPRATWVATAAVCALFLVSYFVAYALTDDWYLAVIGFQVALGVASVSWNAGAAVIFVYAAAFAGRLDDSRRAMVMIGTITAIGGLAAGFSSPTAFASVQVLVMAPLIGAVNWQETRVAKANWRLVLAREQLAHLAATAERERIARDMHDVLGHSLTLIVLKSELASKVGQRDPGAALREIRDVEQASRTALAEIREVIAGYRATWPEAVARARALLDAAGIRGDFIGAPAGMGRGVEEVLARVLREAVTNVVRHAGASVCRVRCEEDNGRFRLEVSDDGAGVQRSEGNGIRGIRERVEQLGGSLSISIAKGTHLMITIPAGG